MQGIILYLFYVIIRTSPKNLLTQYPKLTNLIYYISSQECLGTNYWGLIIVVVQI